MMKNIYQANTKQWKANIRKAKGLSHWNKQTKQKHFWNIVYDNYIMIKIQIASMV